MDDDYYSIESILSENQVNQLTAYDTCIVYLPTAHCNWQKIQCTFKRDIEDMGHLAGGDEKDVSATHEIRVDRSH